MSAVNLPDNLADLPNRFDYAAAEGRIYAFWEQGGYFHSEPDERRRPYTIVIPLPNVTGALHLGHALNTTLQDVQIRYKRMAGFNALWMPGTDHAGIATQAVVEKRLLQEEGKTRHDLGRDELVRRIWQWKDAYQNRILSQLKQMGCSCDWQRTRFTLDEMCTRAVRQTFFDLFKKGLVFRGKRLVNWDTYLQTAVSDDEIFHDTVQGHFWHFQYPVIDPQPGEPQHVAIATTRPETMLGDTAVAVHPDPATELARVEAELTEKLTSAAARDREGIEAQIENVRRRRQSMLPLLEKLRDMAAEGRQVMLPLLERPIPLVADQWAKPELGSGCVKVTPAHDPNDYEVGLRRDLPMINILNPEGTLNADAGPYQGMTITQARERVVADLDRQGLLIEVEDREIDLAHSDRSKTAIEPYLADQWFVKMDQLAQSAMDAVTDGRVKIIPERYAKSYLDWLGEKRDWCIGRQLWWGHRIPIWTAQDPSTAVLEDLSAPSDEFLISRTQEDPETKEITHVACVAPGHEDVERRLESAGFVQDEDVLDTWFSSALWPHSTLGWPEQTPDLAYYYPTSVLITSRDILTLWVARMVLAGLHNVGDIPFREVYIHPKILDGYGETMSKSKGNGVDPVDVIEKFGTDALRFALAHMTTETQDARMPVQFECPHCENMIEQTKKNRELPRIECPKCSQEFSTQWATSEADAALPRGAVVSERFELARNFCNKLWNAARFVLINLEDYSAQPVAADELAIEDRWILSRLASVTQIVTECLDQYRYADAARALYEFAWDEFCSFFVEMVKLRLQDADQRAVAQRVLAYTLDTLMRLLHPLVPFITEEVWQLLGQTAKVRGLEDPQAAAESIIVAPWPEVDRRYQDPRIEEQFAEFQQALAALREIRSRQSIAPKLPIEFCIRCQSSTADLLRPMEPYFGSLAKGHAQGWGPDVEPPARSAHVTLSGMDVYVDLKDLIDEEAERARLEKQLDRMQSHVEGKQKKLANENFVKRAPAEVVQRERDGLAELTEKIAAIQAALDKLAE